MFRLTKDLMTGLGEPKNDMVGIMQRAPQTDLQQDLGSSIHFICENKCSN